MTHEHRGTVPFGHDSYVDGLASLKSCPSPKVLRMLREARGVDEFSRKVVDAIAYCLTNQDADPVDVAVVVEDAQDIVWENYAFLGPLAPVGPAVPGRSFQLRLLLRAEGTINVSIREQAPDGWGRMYIIVEGKGTLTINDDYLAAARGQGPSHVM